MPIGSAPQLPSAETRQRLLEVATEVFATHGYRRTTVREICRAAEANIAAVNYYFGNKAGLYAAVFRHGLAVSLEHHPPDHGIDADAAPEERLRVFIHSFLQRLLGAHTSPHHARLMVMEMSEPTHALDVVVREHIRPLSKRLEAIVREIVGPAIRHDAVMRCAMSIVGQCVFYKHGEQVVAKIAPGQKHTPAALEDLAEHIHRFSLAGLRAVAQAAPLKPHRSSR